MTNIQKMPEFRFNLRDLPLNLRAWEPFYHIKVPKFKCFSSYFGKSCTEINVLKIQVKFKI